MTIKWNEITLNNQHYLEQIYELYVSAFPIEVREPHSMFLKGIQYAISNKPNNFRFLIGLEGTQIVSFATGHYLADVNTGFIVYIVTNPNIRSKGLGTKTIKKLEELLNYDAIAAGYTSIKTIVLETETIDMVHTEEEKENCYKRDKFFERNNYKKYDKFLYLQPPLHAGETEIPLNLFIKNLKENKTSKDELNHIIRAIYKEKYLLVNGIDKTVLNNCLEKMNMDKCFL